MYRSVVLYFGPQIRLVLMVMRGNSHGDSWPNGSRFDSESKTWIERSVWGPSVNGPKWDLYAQYTIHMSEI